MISVHAPHLLVPVGKRHTARSALTTARHLYRHTSSHRRHWRLTRTLDGQAPETFSCKPPNRDDPWSLGQVPIGQCTPLYAQPSAPRPHRGVVRLSLLCSSMCHAATTQRAMVIAVGGILGDRAPTIWAQASRAARVIPSRAHKANSG